MTTPLSPTAKRLAQRLYTQRHKRTRLDELWRVFDEVDPDSRMSLGRRHLLLKTLDELAAANMLRLPSTSSYDRSERPALPRFVTIVRPEPQARPEPDTVWHSQLAWATSANLTTTQREQLTKINDWLFRARPEMTVPVRERSLEILGDEKALDALLTTTAFGNNRLSLQMLRARRVVPRLYTEQVGPGSTLLVVENSDTFDSIVRGLGDSRGNIGMVAWGAGAGFEASVLSVSKLPHTVRKILYFGDLDRAGLRIPANSDRLARASGLPAVRPAARLYDALLRLGSHQPAHTPMPRDDAADLTTWLAPHQRQTVADLLHSGQRMAQEAVGYAYLMSTTDWYPE